MRLRQKSNNALLTGATGYIGSQLTRRLVSDGWKVNVIARSNSSLVLLQPVLKKIKIFNYDGSTEDMMKIFKQSRPSVVIHTAALSYSNHTSRNLIPMLQSNIVLGAQLLEASTALGVRNFINTGSYWQHYNNELYNPVNLYAAMKQAFESILKFYVEAYPLRVITLTLFDTYGADDPRFKLFGFLEKARKNSETIDMTPGKQRIDLVHIDDVIEAYVSAINHFKKFNHGHKVFSVSSGHPIVLRELVKKYERETNSKLYLRWGGRPYRSREIMKPWSLGKLLPGWKPLVNLEEGIRRSCNLD